MLVRNTDWSRRLLDLTAHFGQFPPNMTTEQVLPCTRCKRPQVCTAGSTNGNVPAQLCLLGASNAGSCTARPSG